MDKTFDVEKFMARIGEMSVVQFDDAKAATSPSAVGDAMESPVRDQLQQILPRGIGVGSGFVIDGYGATSQQTDVVLFEKDICPVFSINNTPGTTYYPCEGVIAVGQVKSILNKQLLKDEFRKIASVKRHPVHNLGIIYLCTKTRFSGGAIHGKLFTAFTYSASLIPLLTSVWYEGLSPAWERISLIGK